MFSLSLSLYVCGCVWIGFGQEHAGNDSNAIMLQENGSGEMMGDGDGGEMKWNDTGYTYIYSIVLL